MDGKVIVITGAGSGIGLALATLLASRGASLSICDISEAGLDRATKEVQTTKEDSFLATRVDVRDYKSVEAWITKTVEKFGHIDGAANLAGIIGKDTGVRSVRDLNEDDFSTVLDVNLHGVLRCLKAELAVMKPGASIVNAASVAGLRASSNGSAYVASKHAVIGLTKCAAKEEGPRGIRINAIAPGLIDTPMLDTLEHLSNMDTDKLASTSLALKRKGKPEEIAKLISFLLSDDASYITGSIYTIDAGLTA
ncbi:hypothetical protein MBLNU459_g5093t1 [Dothideomycetes sp. NU459]